MVLEVSVTGSVGSYGSRQFLCERESYYIGKMCNYEVGEWRTYGEAEILINRCEKTEVSRRIERK